MAKINVQMNNVDEVKLEKNTQVKTKKVKENKKKKEKNKNTKTGFFSQIKAEMKPVTWPTKKNMIKYSLATIVMVILLALFFVGLSALFDLLYTLVQEWMIG